MRNKHKISLLYALIGIALLTANLILFQNTILGIIGIIIYAVPIYKHLSLILKEKTFWGFLSFLLIIILFTTALYYIYGITKLTSLIILILPSALCFKKIPLAKKTQIPPSTKKIKHAPAALYARQYALMSTFIILEAALITTLIINRTTSLMPSPWQAVKPWFFILYATATGLLFYIVSSGRRTRRQLLTITSTHLFTTFSITAILYPIGWGFDAFIHRATETWIQNHGFIIPKQPYYIGQYSFVVWLSNLTSIPIFYIDVYLVPILASITLPPAIMYTLKKIWSIPEKYGIMFVWIIPFVPFLHLHLTTPHNMVLLFSVLSVFTSTAFLKNRMPAIIPILLALASITTHPLLGAPMFIFTATALISKKIQNKNLNLIALLVSVFTLAASLPLLFTINNIRIGADLPNLANPFSRLSHFVDLFARPYWYAQNTQIILELLYGWQRLIVPALLILAIIGIYLTREKNKTKDSKLIILISTPIGFILSAFLLRSWVVFPNVVSYEQGDFPLRLIKAALIFLLPYAMNAAYSLVTLLHAKIKTKMKQTISRYALISLISILLMLSFYLSYPQRNAKSRFPGLNVTQNDFKAVEWIHARHDKYDYIVLSNQLVSAAALTKYGFAKYFNTNKGKIFYYSAPTGGPQYKQYGKMLYEGQKREYMLAAMDLAGVKTGYFVLNKYWANSDKIIKGAKKTADEWHVIGKNKKNAPETDEIWIFVYKKP